MFLLGDLFFPFLAASDVSGTLVFWGHYWAGFVS